MRFALPALLCAACLGCAASGGPSGGGASDRDEPAAAGAGGKTDHATCGLSDLGLEVFESMYEADQEWSSIPAGRLLTYDNEAGPALLDGPEIFPALADLIARAEREVDIAMFVFDPGTDPWREIFAGVLALERRLEAEGRRGDPVHVRIVVNNNDLLGGHRVAVPNIREIEALRIDPELVRVHVATRGSLTRGVMHQKVAIIDGRVVHIGGANVQSQHDWTTGTTPWRDSAYVLRGEIAQSLLFDFELMWNEAEEWRCPDANDDHCDSRDTEPFARPERELGEGCLPMMAVGRRPRGGFNNDTSHPHARGYLAALDNAERRIRIQTPNLNDDAAKDALVRALERGVRIDLIIPISFNDTFESLPGQGGTNSDNVDRLYARALDALGAERACELLHVHWFGQPDIGIVDGNVEGQAHAKYLSVDDQLVIVGSTNMDTQSWNFSGELNVAIDDAATARRYDETVFEVSLATSPPTGHCADVRAAASDEG